MSHVVHSALACDGKCAAVGDGVCAVRVRKRDSRRDVQRHIRARGHGHALSFALQKLHGACGIAVRYSVNGRLHGGVAYAISLGHSLRLVHHNDEVAFAVRISGVALGHKLLHVGREFAARHRDNGGGAAAFADGSFFALQRTARHRHVRAVVDHHRRTARDIAAADVYSALLPGIHSIASAAARADGSARHIQLHDAVAALCGDGSVRLRADNSITGYIDDSAAVCLDGLARMLHRAAVDVQFNGAVLVAAHIHSQTVAPSTQDVAALDIHFHILFAADAEHVIGIALRNRD